MKTTLTTLAALSLLVSPLTVLAQTGAAPAPTVRETPVADAALAKRIADAKERAAREISRRVASLSALIERIKKMARLSPADQQMLQGTLEGQVTALTALQVQIQSQTSTTTLRADIESITQSYRIYALVMPQIALIAAADRTFAVAGQLELLVLKLQDRITAMGVAGGSTTELQATLEHMKAKLVDAAKKVQEAVDAIVVLVPDNSGEQNLRALKDAHAKIRAAQQDLVEARKDAMTIAKALREFTKANTATTTPTTN